MLVASKAQVNKIPSPMDMNFSRDFNSLRQSVQSSTMNQNMNIYRQEPARKDPTEIQRAEAQKIQQKISQV